MDKNLTEVVVIADRSASMNMVASEARTGFNNFLEEQKKCKVGRCVMTYVQFNTDYDIVHAGVPVESVEPLNEFNYRPEGWTALYDAVGRAIDEVGSRLSNTPEAQRPGNVIFVIMTDGQENASREYTREQVKQKIEHQQTTYSWSFVFLGQNIDAAHAGGRIGLRNSDPNVVVGQVSAGGKGYGGAYKLTGSAVTKKRCRAFAGQATNFTAADKQEFECLLRDSDSDPDSHDKDVIVGSADNG